MNKYEQLAQILADEINVKYLVWCLGDSEKGKIEIIYKDKNFSYRLGGKIQNKKPSVEVISKLF